MACSDEGLVVKGGAIERFTRPIQDSDDAAFWAMVRTATSYEHRLNRFRRDLHFSRDIYKYIILRGAIEGNLIKKLMYTDNTLQVLQNVEKSEYIEELREKHLNAEKVFLQAKRDMLAFDSVQELPYYMNTKRDIKDFIESLDDRCNFLFVSQKRYGKKGPANVINDIKSICKRINRNLLIIGCQFNKQKDEMSHELYLKSTTGLKFQTCLLDKGICASFDYDPAVFPLITDEEGNPIYTMARKMDGAYPDSVNPRVLWEAKEYYDNKTYGSWVNDSIFETILSGKECLEIQRLFPQRSIKHFLFVDGFYCLGILGRALLLRYIDCFFQNIVDDIIVGSDVIDVWPAIANQLISKQEIQRGFSLFYGW